MTLPLEERKRALADPAQRATRGETEALNGRSADYSDFARMEIARTFEPANAGFAGRRVSATSRASGALDAMLDIALADGCARSSCWCGRGGREELVRLGDPARSARRRRKADAGAHLDIGTASPTDEAARRRVCASVGS
ncbi:MAG: hypothetical protein R3F21_22865 [Myxococcota bacterium]